MKNSTAVQAQNGGFSFQNGIKIQMSDSIAQNYSTGFSKMVYKNPVIETRVLSIFAPYTRVLLNKIHIVQKDEGRLSWERPIIVSQKSPVMYLWTGQGRQAFEIALSPEEHARATCKNPVLQTNQAVVPPLPPVNTKEVKMSDATDHDMLRCLLDFKRGLQSPRQVSVTVARCQAHITACGYSDVLGLYEQWFVKSGVAIQPHTSASTLRVRIDHKRLEALLSQIGCLFNDHGSMTSGFDSVQKVVEDEVTTTEPQQPVLMDQLAPSKDQSPAYCDEVQSPLLSLLPADLDRDQQIDWLADFIDRLAKR